eukprot:6190430-Pleurochrysis_carterae.AAC.1
MQFRRVYRKALQGRRRRICVPAREQACPSQMSASFSCAATDCGDVEYSARLASLQVFSGVVETSRSLQGLKYYMLHHDFGQHSYCNCTPIERMAHMSCYLLHIAWYRRLRYRLAA